MTYGVRDSIEQTMQALICYVNEVSLTWIDEEAKLSNYVLGYMKDKAGISCVSGHMMYLA